MTLLEAKPNPIMVTGYTSEETTITYKKEEWHELWERLPGSTTWSRIDEYRLVGRGAATEGAYPKALMPGQSYEVGIYEQAMGPYNEHEMPLERVRVFCLRNRSNLITTQSSHASGGTWHSHFVHTNVPTRIVGAGVSQVSPSYSLSGFPRLQNPVGIDPEPSRIPLLEAETHSVNIGRKCRGEQLYLGPLLLPSTHYFCVVIVTDANGRWDYKADGFDTLRRKLTVTFNELKINVDGDDNNINGEHDGEAYFKFYVYEGGSVRDLLHSRRVHFLQTPMMSIGDGDIYDLRLMFPKEHRYESNPDLPGEWPVMVQSKAIEDDGITTTDKVAESTPMELPLDVGRCEDSSGSDTFNCAEVNSADDLNYDVTVSWKVEYVP